MMRAIFILVLSLLGAEYSLAQKLYLSDKEDINLRYDDFAVVGKMEDANVVYRKRNKKAELIFYNATMNKIRSVAMDMVAENYSQIFFLANGKTILAAYQQRENKKENLYVSQLQSDMKWSTPILLTSIPSGGLRQNLSFTVARSQNNSKMLLYSYYYENDTWNIEAFVLSDQMKLITQIKQPLQEREWIINEEAAVSNEGNAYLLYHEKPSSKGSVNEFSILSAKQRAAVFTINPIEVNKHAVSDFRFAIDPNHTMVYLCGFYAEGRFNTPKGIYYTAFDEEQQAAPVSHFVPLALQVTQGRNDLKDFKIRHLSVKTDGGIEVVAEKYFQSVRTITSMNPTFGIGMMSVQDNSRTINEYYYDELAIFNLKVDGSVAWSQVMLKEQLSNDDMGIYSSIGILEHKQGKVYLFNDVNSKTPRLMAGIINNNSEMTMKEIPTDVEMQDWNWMPRSAKQLSKAEIVLPCVMKSYLCFLKISF